MQKSQQKIQTKKLVALQVVRNSIICLYIFSLLLLYHKLVIILIVKIRAIIKPNSKKGPLVGKKNDDTGEYLEIFVREPAIEGKANAAVIKLLSEYYSVAKTRIVLKKGQGSRFKTFEINY